MIVPIPEVHLGVGIAMAAVSLPLILRMIPMNRFYGIRVRKAYVSERNWYDLNAYGGKVFFAYGVFLAAFGRVMKDSAPPPTSPWSPVYLTLPFLPIFLVLYLINTRGRRLPDE